MGGLQLLEPALAKGPRGLFSLFLQEIYSHPLLPHDY
jgi:hypothetical protein